MYPVWWGLHDTLIPLDSTYASPGPQNEIKNLKKNSSDYFHILHIVELWCDFKMFVGPWSIYIYNVYELCWPMYTDLGRPGGYICGCGRPSNLVVFFFHFGPIYSNYYYYYYYSIQQNSGKCFNFQVEETGLFTLERCLVSSYSLIDLYALFFSSQTAKRTIPMLFVRGDGVILVSPPMRTGT